MNSPASSERQFPVDDKFAREFAALIGEILDSELAIKWLSVDLQLSQDALLNAGRGSRVLEAFDLLKALRKPLDIIPATLHPINLTA